jgi:hypothetical protein
MKGFFEADPLIVTIMIVAEGTYRVIWGISNNGAWHSLQSQNSTFVRGEEGHADNALDLAGYEYLGYKINKGLRFNASLLTWNLNVTWNEIFDT